ncbi:MAG TPA: hypothetical protein VEO00_11890 [Actinomycetota bacterium]|nr:hypothetical protein [Actinomycetota bacterium]
MRRSRLALAALLSFPAVFGGALVAPPAAARSPAVRLVAPQPGEARGRVIVRVDAEGDPAGAAFEVRPRGSGWDEALAVPLQPSAGGFEAVLDTRPLPNGAYRLLARAWWADAVAYDPADGDTFAADGIALSVANPPPRPALASPRAGRGRVSLSWTQVATSDRSDFAGYGVYRAAARSGRCSAFGPLFVRVETTFGTTHVSSGLARGRYCFAVVALRTSPVAAEVASRATAPSLVRVVRGGPPVSEGGDPDAAQGPYVPTLPYDPADLVKVVAAVIERGGLRDVGPLGSGRERQALVFVAVGLLLAVAAAGLLFAMRVPRETPARLR